MTDASAGKNAEEQDAKLSDAFDVLEKKADDPQIDKPEPTAGARSTSSVGVVLAVFLALVAIGVASYPAYVIYRQQASDPDDAMPSRVAQLQQLQQEQQKLESRSSNLGNSLDNLGRKLVAIEQKQSADLDALQVKLLATFESRIADLQNQDGTTSRDWLLAEVEYLLRMANQRLLMERDPAAALGLFMAADGIIADSQGLTAFSLRQAMATDMARLEAVEGLDEEGLYLRLSALIGQVKHLKQRKLAYNAPVEVDDFPVQDSTFIGGMLEFANKVLSRITSLVDYRRDEMEVTPILPPSEEYYLRQNLILKFQVAQLALLENSGEVFSVSLGESDRWIEKYFDAEHSATIAMRAGIEDLMTINVQQELPDVSVSLREVRTLLAEFHQAEASP